MALQTHLEEKEKALNQSSCILKTNKNKKGKEEIILSNFFIYWLFIEL